MEAATPPAASGTDLVTAPHATEAFELAERAFTPERREQITRFLGIRPDEPALVPYLAICAQYDLSPVMGEIWLIEQRKPVWDGDANDTKWMDVLRPAIGRDGLLKCARRTKGWKGFQSGVVCEHDTFEVEYTGDFMTDPKVVHRYRSKPTEFGDGDDPRTYRGAIIGAWAKTQVEGQAPVFYFADLREHGRVKAADKGGGWQGAWSHTQAMIIKAAVSYVLRLAIGVSGVVPWDEVGVIDSTATEERDEDADPNVAIAEALESHVESEHLRRELADAISDANALEAFSWAPAKVNMRIAGKSEDDHRAVLAEVRAEVERRRSNLSAGAATNGDGEEDAAIEDAQVYEEADVEAREVAPGWVLQRGEGDDMEWLTVVDVAGDDNVVALMLDGGQSAEFPPDTTVHVQRPEA